MHSTKIFLCGFMGAGKTTFLQRFSGSGFYVIDLDEEISSRYKAQIGKIVEEIGWEKFRNLELSYLKKILESNKDMVVALGGGAFGNAAQTMIFSYPNNSVVWLDTDLEKCIKRIKIDSHRPLAKLGTEYLRNLYFTRIRDYEKSNLRLNESAQDKIKSLEDLISLIPLK